MEVDWWSCWGSQGVARFGGLEVKQVESLWKNHVCQVRGRISQLDVGLSTQTIFFQIYRVVSGWIRSFGCGFWVVPEVLKIEMWETLKKVEKSTYCARTVCCCMNFANVEFFLNVVHVYQLAGHLVGGDIPLSHRKKNRRRYEKVCKSWMKIRTQSSTSRLGIGK
jgi:predicted membrane-bound spermidine synthase